MAPDAPLGLLRSIFKQYTYSSARDVISLFSSDLAECIASLLAHNRLVRLDDNKDMA